MSKKELPNRVTIKYSVDFLEVPERVQIMLLELASSFSSLSNMSTTIAEGAKTDFIETLKEMQALSILLSKAKIRVDDCSEILLGFTEILTAIAAERTQEEEVPAKKPPAKKKKKEEG